MPRKSSADLTLVLPNVEGHPSRIAPPRDLPADERKLFLSLVNSCAPEHFRQSDVVLLTRYCETACLCARANRELKANGVVSIDGVVSPWLAVRSRCVRELAILSSRLRLAPSSRSPRPASKRFIAP